MSTMAELTRIERLALIELLETLTPDQWETQSLCQRWTVQDVAAHMAFTTVLAPRRLPVELARARMNVDRMIGDIAIRDSARGVPAILDQLRRNAESGAKPLGKADAALADSVVHQLDVRRPLGRPRQIPEEAFRWTAEFFARTGFPGSLVVGGNVRKRVAGLRLVADDVAWSYGDGPEVRGSSESLMLMLAGRRVADDELSGPGVEVLRLRR